MQVSLTEMKNRGGGKNVYSNIRIETNKITIISFAGKGYKMDICQVAALRIRKMRLEKNMTIDDLAEKCDVSTQTIKLIEAGRRNFKIKTLYTIANSLNVSSDYLIGRIDTPVPESTVVGNLISELTTEEVIYLVSILSRYVEILKKAGTDRNENSSV